MKRMSIYSLLFLITSCNGSTPTSPSSYTPTFNQDGTSLVQTQAANDRAPFNANCGDTPNVTQANPQGTSVVFEWHGSSMMTKTDMIFRKKPNIKGITDTEPSKWPIKKTDRAYDKSTHDIDNTNNRFFEAGSWAVQVIESCGSFQSTGGWSNAKEFTISGPQADPVECKMLSDEEIEDGLLTRECREWLAQQ